MKKSLVIIVAVILVAIIIAISAVSTYNGLVKSQEEVNEKQSQVGVYLQRRADLIPNFVATVKGYSDYEQSTLTAVTEARAAVGNAKTVTEQEAAQTQLNDAVRVWVNAVTEAYPELKANSQYQALLDELAGSENRIGTARKDYNDAAKSYNTKIRTFPTNIFAGIFGFGSVDYFKADESSSTPPVVKFD